MAHVLAWSPDGKLIAVGDGAPLRIHDAATGEWIRDLKDAASNALAIAWSPDGKLVASCDQQDLKIHDAASGTLRVAWNLTNAWAPILCGEQVDEIRWSPDGKRISTGGLSGFTEWDAKSGKRIRTRPISGGHLSPDGLRIAGRGAAQISLLDRSGRPLGAIAALTDPLALAISAEGHYRGSTGIESEIVYVVRTKDGQETLTPEEFSRKYGWKNDPDRVKFDP